MTWQCRWSSTLGELEATHQEIWGTSDYVNDTDPTVFMGLYSLVDFYALWRHKGRKAVLWCGSDIKHFSDGYWLDKRGLLTVMPYSLGVWINKNCESWTENQVERKALMKFGIKAKVCPSFLGDVNKFEVRWKYAKRPKVYCSVSGDNFEMYGWDTIERVAEFCQVDFYLYGNIKRWKTRHKNVFVRGRVTKEVMNKEIEEMQCGLRPLEFDGFSEVLAKAILMGQHPISRIKYPMIASYETDDELISQLNKLQRIIRPNIDARDFYLKKLNQFPWNTNA